MEVEFPAIFPPVLALIGLHCKMLGKMQTLSRKLLLLHSQRLMHTRSKIGICYLVSACLLHQMLLDCDSSNIMYLCDMSRAVMPVWATTMSMIVKMQLTWTLHYWGKRHLQWTITIRCTVHTRHFCDDHNVGRGGYISLSCCSCSIGN